MKSMITKILLGVALIAISVPAMAREGRGGHGGEGQNRGQKRRGMPGAAARIERQKEHIQRALDKGKISQEQATALQGKVDAIQAKRDAAMSDGKVTKEERKEIRGDLKSSKQEIRNTIKPEDSSPGSSGSSSSESSSSESNN